MVVFVFGRLQNPVDARLFGWLSLVLGENDVAYGHVVLHQRLKLFQSHNFNISLL